MFAAAHPSLVKNSIITLYYASHPLFNSCKHNEKFVHHAWRYALSVIGISDTQHQLLQTNKHYCQHNPCMLMFEMNSVNTNSVNKITHCSNNDVYCIDIVLYWCFIILSWYSTIETAVIFQCFFSFNNSIALFCLCNL